MITFETLALAYFVVIGAAAAFARASGMRRVWTLLGAVGIAVTIAAATHLPLTARLWLGHLYLVAGYWLPALLVASNPPAGAARFEMWLRRTDARLGWPHPPAAGSPVALELSYLLCYPLVPAAFAIAWTLGSDEAAERFWTAVLAAGFACYGTLPWLIARPPRHAALQPETRSGSAPLRLVNQWVLRRVSHGMNTFPSGHVAVSVAASLEILALSWPAGLVLLMVAAGIAAGAAAGRYHYVIDVLLGAAVGALASLAA